MNITVAGHVCADLTPRLPLGVGMVPGHLYDIGALRITAGGCIVNVGRVLSELGVRARLVGKLGSDDLGAIVLRAMAEAELDATRISQTAAEGTSYSIVIEPAGVNRSFWHHTGANREFDGADIVLDDTHILHVGYPSLVPGLIADGGAPLARLLRRAKEADVTTSLDLAVVDQASQMGHLDWHSMLTRALSHVDIFTPSLDDLTSTLETGPISTLDEARALADEMLGLGPAVVMLSVGEDGLLLRTASAERLHQGGPALSALAESWADASIWVPALPITEVVTTNGAGDAASAGLLYGIAAGMSPEEGAQLATLVASQWIQGLTAQHAARPSASR